MEPQADQIDLLLASAREHRPVLEDGLAADALIEAPKPKKDVSQLRARRDAERSDLRLQRWGVIVPEGKTGEALLEAIKPLVALRSEEQGAPPMVFEVPPGLNRKESREWLFDKYEDEHIDEAERPLYLCLLGSPEQTSFELQHTVGHRAYIGRIHFEKPNGDVDLDAYAAYARKVARYAREGVTSERPDLTYYVAPDGSRATRNAIPKLVSPSIEASERSVANGRLNASVRQLEVDSVDLFLTANASSRPSVLLSVSHGLGGSPDDYNSADEQRMRQGALVVGRKEVLDAEAMTGKTFLPGGLWLFFACFGAATPSTSEYYKWLDVLAKTGTYQNSAKAVLSSLAMSGSGFIAALPQAALRNPNGPLAVIGHVDLAWNYSYVDPSNPSKSRSSKFTRVLHTMTRGARVGSAHDEIMEQFREANFELSSMYDTAEDARIAGRPDPTDPKAKARIWMLRNDLRGYILLGDPAVRLPQAELNGRKPAEAPEPPVVEVQTAAPTMTQDAKTAAVQALLEGNEAPRVIAERAGCSLAELFAWFDAHRGAERKKQMDGL